MKISGWVKTRRDHGKIIFIDLRDRSGVLQCVITPDKKEMYDLAQDIRSEFVLEFEGLVKKRPDNAINSDINTGTVEMEVTGYQCIERIQNAAF